MSFLTKLKRATLSLTGKLILAFSVFVFLLVTPLSAYFYIELSDTIERQTENYLTSLAEAVEGQVYLFFDRTEVRVGDWSSDGYIKQMTEKILKDRDPKDAETLGGYFSKNKLPLNHSVKLLEVINPQGEIIASSEQRRVGMMEHEHITPERKEEVSKAKYGEVFIEGLEEEEEEFHPIGLMFHAMTPIKSLETGETIGILLFHYDAGVLNEILSGKWQVKKGAITGQEFTQRFSTSEIYLVNRDRLLMSPVRFVDDGVLKQKIDTVPVKECFENNKEFSGEYLNYSGSLSHGASMCLSRFNMVLIVEIQKDEVFADLIDERKDFTLLALLLWILGILIAILFGHFFLRGIKIIHSVAVEVSKGNFDVRADVKSGDESGELAKVFNKMLDDIGQSEKELSEMNKKLQEANQEIEKEKMSLEAKVRERTKELEDIKASLELSVSEKTVELEKRVKDLEKFKKLTLGRELRMVELKEEIEALKNKPEAGK